MENKTSVATH